MQALRQLGGGVIIAIFSVILVLGGIFLSLAETLPPAATPTQIPPTLPQSFPTPTATTTLLETLTETASPLQPTAPPTETASPFPTVISLPPCPPPALRPPGGYASSLPQAIRSIPSHNAIKPVPRV